MSTYAENVKIITENGMVTLRSPVASEKERARIEEIAKRRCGNRQGGQSDRNQKGQLSCSHQTVPLNQTQKLFSGADSVNPIYQFNYEGKRYVQYSIMHS